MKDLIIPIDNPTFNRSGREKTLKAIRDAGCNSVLLSIGGVEADPERRAKILAELAENIPFVKNSGFSVGVWLWAFQCRNGRDFTHITGMSGRKSDDECCPADPDFRECAAGFVREIAKLHPDLILLDDDLRFGHFDCGLGCLCDFHRADIANRLGSPETADLAPAELSKKIFSGGKNEFRDAYMDSLADSLREYCKALRAAVDSVDPKIRLGQCACITTWDSEGTDSVELSKILAGSTKPFLRLIGAPYWGVSKAWGNRLADVIETERMELSYTENSGIEIFTEGDAYPRPRWNIPAAYLELFDLALRADGRANGIMKYMLDYRSNAAGYEPGYLEAHARHTEARAEIDSAFDGSTAIGVRVYEEQHKLKNAVLPEFSGDGSSVQDRLFSFGARFANAMSLPIVWNGAGCAGIAFGENAAYLPDSAFEKPLILDLPAAKILMERGIDVGIRKIGEGASGPEEHFLDENDFTRVDFRCPVMKLGLDPSAKVLSELGSSPVAFTYEARIGHKFLVFAFDAAASDAQIFRNYHRQREVNFFVNPPVSCPGHPDLYIFAAERNGKISALLLNISPDKIYDPEVKIGGETYHPGTIHAFDHAIICQK